jgi:hypothetical protein
MFFGRIRLARKKICKADSVPQERSSFGFDGVNEAQSVTNRRFRILPLHGLDLSAERCDARCNLRIIDLFNAIEHVCGTLRFPVRYVLGDQPIGKLRALERIIRKPEFSLQLAQEFARVLRPLRQLTVAVEIWSIKH